MSVKLKPKTKCRSRHNVEQFCLPAGKQNLQIR